MGLRQRVSSRARHFYTLFDKPAERTAVSIADTRCGKRWGKRLAGGRDGNTHFELGFFGLQSVQARDQIRRASARDHHPAQLA